MCHYKYSLTSGKEEIQWRTKRCYSPAKFYLLYPPFISSKVSDSIELICILSPAKKPPPAPRVCTLGSHPCTRDPERQQTRGSERGMNFWRLQDGAKERSFKKHVGFPAVTAVRSHKTFSTEFFLKSSKDSPSEPAKV